MFKSPFAKASLTSFPQFNDTGTVCYCYLPADDARVYGFPPIDIIFPAAYAVALVFAAMVPIIDINELPPPPPPPTTGGGPPPAAAPPAPPGAPPGAIIGTGGTGTIGGTKGGAATGFD